MRPWLLLLSLFFATACGNGASGDDTTPAPASANNAPGDEGPESPETAPTEPPPGFPPPPAERRAMTAEECAAEGGHLVGDIGDGRTHRADYRCENGRAPLGRVALGTEGSVCCGS